MSETMKKIVLTLVIVAVFIICIALVVTGQRNIGPAGLMRMLVGLAGLVALLGLYNKQYK